MCHKFYVDWRFHFGIPDTSRFEALATSPRGKYFRFIKLQSRTETWQLAAVSRKGIDFNMVLHNMRFVVLFVLTWQDTNHRKNILIQSSIKTPAFYLAILWLLLKMAFDFSFCFKESLWYEVVGPKFHCHSCCSSPMVFAADISLGYWNVTSRESYCTVPRYNGLSCWRWRETPLRIC